MRNLKTLCAFLLGFCMLLVSCSDRSSEFADEKQLKVTIDPGDILDDIKLTVKSGTASSYQSGSDIEKSFDDDFSTIYHSSWNNSSSNYFPITLTYNFENVTTMDYLIYNPRTSGGNGHFKEVDLYVATASQPTLTKYGSYDFKGSSTASRIEFSPALVNPIKVQFVIKSGAGDGQGFASCSEMQFFQKNNANFDYLTIFTDKTATQLKPGVTQTVIDAIDNRFFRELATEIYTNTYNTEFRVQNYNSWQHPDIMASSNKTSTYGLRDNPTGIYATLNEDIVVFADELYGQNISIFIQESGNKLNGSSYTLTSGLNKFKAKNAGLIYVMYYTATGTENPVKLNIATGTVNGYFDKLRHTQADWSRLLAAATFQDFDVKGQYAVLTFRTAAFRQYTANGAALIQAYDDLVYNEQDFMGLVKYNKMFKNKAYFLAVEDGYMYAGGYHTGYHIDTQSEILDVNKLKTTACWGPAHELGHTHQTRPGLKWAGMAEVTNNIHSLYIQTLWGNRTRLIDEDLGGGLNRYNKGFNSTLVGGLALNDEPDVFCRLIPFWQLKLYLMDVLGKADFYKDIYEYVRITPDVTTNSSNHGLSQLQFVKAACDIAQLDLTEFFESWGFLRPIDKSVDDYGTYQFKITQSEINNLKSEIAGRGYSKPVHNLKYITDDNISLFKSNTSITQGTATASGNSLTLNGWGGVIAFEIYLNGTLNRVTTETSIGLSTDPSAYEIWAVGATGNKVKVNIVAGNKVAISSASASVSQPGEGIERSYDGNLSTLYHSPWNNSTNYFPVTMTYNFSNVEKISYLIYQPRTSGTNGIFKEFDLYVATESSPTLTKYGTYNFNGSTSTSQITFTSPLISPTTIQFIVKSGVGNFVSCAEMGFFRQ